MSEKLKGQYQKLQKKHKLPDFKELDREFDLGNEETSFPLRHIRKRISEFLESYTKILEEIINPESSIGGLYECKTFDDAKKEELFNKYKELMKLLRYSLEVSLKNSESDEAEFVSYSFNQWRSIRKSLLPLAKELKDSWDKETKIKEELEYFG